MPKGGPSLWACHDFPRHRQDHVAVPPVVAIPAVQRRAHEGDYLLHRRWRTKKLLPEPVMIAAFRAWENHDEQAHDQPEPTSEANAGRTRWRGCGVSALHIRGCSAAIVTR
jgi:hypothetical protein